MITTIEKVRELSGFDNSTNITDAVVRGKILTAEGMVESAVGARYALPIPYHKSNTLTFGGAGSGSGTMAIVINGTTYNITIANGLTASQAADLFRTAVKDSVDFITDSLGSGAVVLLISITDSSDTDTSYDEVNITSAPTTNGITGTIGTRIDRYPPFLEQLAAEIAAAMLLQDNYGAEAEDTDKDGNKKMGIADIKLQRIQGVDTETGLKINIFDEITKAELPASSIDIPSFRPSTTTNEDEDDPTGAILGINKEF